MCFVEAAAVIAAAEAATAATAIGATTATVVPMGATAAGALTAGTAATAGMTALQTASLYSSIAGTALSAYGQYQQASAARDAARYNQKVAEIQASDALDRGDQEQAMLGRKVADLRGRQRVAMAKSGLDLSEGSPAAILDQTDYYGLEDQRTIANNARREAAGYANRGNLAGMQADGMDPLLATGGSLLTNAGTVADKWYRYNYGGRNYANAMG